MVASTAAEAPQQRPCTFAYGFPPPRLFQEVNHAVVTQARAKQLRVISHKSPKIDP